MNSGIEIKTGEGIIKPKISKINSEIQRITSAADGKQIVVVPRNLLQAKTSTTNQPLTMTKVQDTKSLNTNQSQQSVTKQIATILTKNGNDKAANSAEIKSLLICGQAKALMQHKQHPLPSQQSTQNNGSINNYKTLQVKMEPMETTELLDSLSNINNKNIISEDAGQYDETPGVVRRKHCNCSKSQCLKLYCECFANGEFCQNCTCKDCFNNLQYEDERQRAIRSCLERNPSAFK